MLVALSYRKLLREFGPRTVLSLAVCWLCSICLLSLVDITVNIISHILLSVSFVVVACLSLQLTKHS